MGTIMSVFMQEQREKEQGRVEDVRVFMNINDAAPELMSPIPQKVSKLTLKAELRTCLEPSSR